jgi:hypothetical protein
MKKEGIVLEIDQGRPGLMAIPDIRRCESRYPCSATPTLHGIERSGLKSMRLRQFQTHRMILEGEINLERAVSPRTPNVRSHKHWLQP